MDCEVFEVLLDDLARELPMDASIQKRGLDHAQDCIHCGRRLAEARCLSRALRAMATADALNQAPLVVEGTLLNAFEEHMKADPPIRAARFLLRGWRPIAAAAAVIVAGLAGGLVLRHGKTPGDLTRTQGLTAQSRTAVTSAASTAGSKAGEDRNPGRQQAGTGRPAVNTGNRASPKTRHPASHVVWATDFLPLPYADDVTPLGDARILRLRLPDSALAALGLPVNEDSATKEVTADVLVGEDGIPRAISLVQL